MNKWKGSPKICFKTTSLQFKKLLKKGLTEDEVIEIHEAFYLFDADHSGIIDNYELKQALSILEN